MHTLARFRTPWPAALLLLLALFCLGEDGCGVTDGDEPANTVPVVSDVHFTPFNDPLVFNALVAAEAGQWEDIFENSTATALPGYGEECNYPLLEQSLDAAAAATPKPAFAVFPGDILCHHFNTLFAALYGSTDQTALRAFILKTVRFFILQMQKRFGDTPVVFTLGNNDAYSGDYNLVPGGQFLADTAAPFFNAFLDGSADAAAYDSSYKAGGYYSAHLGRSDILFISLNSVLFSTHRPAPSAGDAAHAQLDWLASQLASAESENRRVYLVTHVPPGVDTHSTMAKYMNADGTVSDSTLMWHSAYQERYLDIVGAYRDVIQGVFAGHTHMDQFMAVYDSNRTEPPDPLIVDPSVSPVFGNNPGYKIFTLNARSWAVSDYAAFALDLANASTGFARAYDFTEQYPVPAPDGPGLAELFPLLSTNATVKQAYIDHYYLGSPNNPINATNWNIYRCASAHVRNASFMACVNGTGGNF